jgi:poly-gamma-glutamate synthesis protein (capsule biosynthesis protein)
MMKRIFAFLLIIAMTAALTGGCAEPPPALELPANAPSPSAVPESAPTPEPAPESTPEPTPEPNPAAKIQLAGDLLLHWGPINAAGIGDGAYDFSPYFTHLAPYVDGDLNIFNLEVPIDAYGGNTKLSSYPRFNSPFEALLGMTGAGFNFAVAANNHSVDQGFSGLAATRNSLERAGLAFTGINETQAQHDEHSIVDINGIKVGIIAYAESLNGLDSLLRDGTSAYAVRRFSAGSSADAERIIADMEACREAGADFIIISLHWGVEYEDSPRQWQRDLAQKLCAGGADIIFGHHSHSMHPVEWLPGKDGREALVFYSMGNFFADQYGINRPKTQFGVLADIFIEKDLQSGITRITSAGYRPTFTHRYHKPSSPNNYGYNLLIAGEFLEGENGTRPPIFLTDREWELNKQAYAHVTKIIGDVIDVIE